MLQTLVTALIVIAAAGYSAWKLAPATWRRGAAQRSGELARAAGASDRLARVIQIKATAAADAGTCGDCGPCKGCAVGQGKDAAGQPPTTT